MFTPQNELGRLDGQKNIPPIQKSRRRCGQRYVRLQEQVVQPADSRKPRARKVVGVPARSATYPLTSKTLKIMSDLFSFRYSFRLNTRR